MLLQRGEPVRGCEAVDNGNGAEVKQTRRDGGLLGRNDDACAEMALQTDGGKKRLGEAGALGSVGHELVSLVEGNDPSNLGGLLEEQAQADPEERARHLGRDARARQVHNGKPAGLEFC